MTTPTRNRRRWHRVVIPFAVLLVLIVGSSIAYWTQQVDTGDAAYLAPDSDADIGGDRLARLLRERGVTVQPTTKSSNALVAAYEGDVTLFVPAPDRMHPYYLRMLKLLPATTRVVVVEPSKRVLAAGRFPVGRVDRRVAVRAAPPGCELGVARDAGNASVVRSRYVVDGDGAEPLYRCYDGGLVGYRRGAEITLVGSTDPFRNDRIAEHHNADLAVGLLSRTTRVIWLDRHEPEPAPKYVDDPALADGPKAPPSLGPPRSGEGDPDFPIPGSEDPGDPEADLPEGGGGGASGDNPLLSAFPPWLYAAVALLALSALALAVGMARRLGSPVVEPLPVTVRAGETVLGRGRLYARAKARGPALRVLRDAARDRIARLLDLPREYERATMISAVSQHTGWPAETVESTLYGPDEPADDKALVAAAKALDHLQRTLKENR